MGIFITLEGIDGSGKTTASEILKKLLENEGFQTALIKEPTETPLGNFIRKEVLGSASMNKWDAMSALFLFSAERAVHINEIKAKLKYIDVIICDRFIDSTFAYQSVDTKKLNTVLKAAGNSDDGGEDDEYEDKNKKFREFILTVNEFILKQKSLEIKRTYLFDLEPKTALGRLDGRTFKIDGFDSRPFDFFSSVRNNYLFLSKKYPWRIKIIDASKLPEKIALEIKDDILKIFKNRF